MVINKKYQFPLVLGEHTVQATAIVRDYYNHTAHVTVTTDAGDYAIAANAVAAEHAVSFEVKFAKDIYRIQIQKNDDGCVVTASTDGGSQESKGTVSEISPEDDQAGKAGYRYRALILYSSLTGNTAKIAQAFRETLEQHCFQVDMEKVTSKMTFALDFSAYDIVCLGSPIIAGSPTKVVMKKLSLGGGGNQPTGDEPLPGGGMPPMPEGAPPLPSMPGGMAGECDNTPMASTYAGGPPPHGVYQPLGVVFTTYGGGFYGSNEAMATLETMKLYLELQNVVVAGRFACCGKETGPAGLRDGEIPATFSGKKLDPPVYYRDADGKYHAGSFFFHAHMEDRPYARDVEKAKYLMTDLIEDYFYSSDGIRRQIASQFISIS